MQCTLHTRHLYTAKTVYAHYYSDFIMEDYCLLGLKGQGQQEETCCGPAGHRKSNLRFIMTMKIADILCIKPSNLGKAGLMLPCNQCPLLHWLTIHKRDVGQCQSRAQQVNKSNTVGSYNQTHNRSICRGLDLTIHSSYIVHGVVMPPQRSMCLPPLSSYFLPEGTNV